LPDSTDAVARMLVSFYYWRTRDLRKLDVMAEPLTRAGGKLELFADSGAFSAFTQRGQGASIKREDYAAWLDTWRSKLRVMVNLDVIGDAKASARNQLWFEQRGLNVVPVYHMQSPLAELHALCRDYDYICIGGTAQARGPAKLRASARAMLIAREHGTAVHGLGRSSGDELAAIPYYSVDSTTWMQSSRFGDIFLFDGKALRRMPIGKAVALPSLVRKHGGDPQKMCRRDYAMLGRSATGRRPDYDEYRRENDEVVFIAAVAWKRFEAWLRRRHAVPAPPGHEAAGTNVWFADDNMLHQQQMMNAVAWLAAGGPARTRKVSDEADRALQGDGG
jgi:hypothetical protein